MTEATDVSTTANDVSTTTAIIAALPREIAHLVRGTPADVSLLERGVHLYRLPRAVVIAAGMGADRAAIAVEAALGNAQVDTLISTGLAGACSAQLTPGTVVEASTVIESRTGERFACSCPHAAPACVLATTVTIACVQEKARLAATYNAALVDMEAATVARLAAAHGLRFRAIKGISDAHDFELAALGRFAGKHGSFRIGAFALHTAVHPRQWSKAMRLGRESQRALTELDRVLRATLASV